MTARGLIAGCLIAIAGVAPGAAQGGGGGRGTAPSGSFAKGRLGLIEDAFVLKKEQTKQVKTILESGDRTQAGPTAPPQGLYLMRVTY